MELPSGYRHCVLDPYLLCFPRLLLEGYMGKKLVLRPGPCGSVWTPPDCQWMRDLQARPVLSGRRHPPGGEWLTLWKWLIDFSEFLGQRKSDLAQAPKHFKAYLPWIKVTFAHQTRGCSDWLNFFQSYWLTFSKVTCDPPGGVLSTGLLQAHPMVQALCLIFDRMHVCLMLVRNIRVSLHP